MCRVFKLFRQLKSLEYSYPAIPAEEKETDGVQLFIKTVIYRNLKAEYSITSWEEEDCAEK
jgi:hypothetical protein